MSEGNKHEESSKMSENSNDKPKEKERKQDEVYKPRLPYPQKFNRHKLDEQFGQFIEMLNKIILIFLSPRSWNKCQTMLSFLRKF